VADDRGVVKVQYYDGERFVCEAGPPTFSCPYRITGADVGRNTLIAVAIDGADQRATATRVVTVQRFAPKLSLAVKARGHKVTASGTLSDAGSCSGRVRISGGGVTTRAKVRSNCTYRATLRLARTGKVRVSARFEGNRSTAAKSAKSRTARLG
ncbi:MAG TPA: hypothetical protein VFJ50_09190, partial [Gemmatimonadales bacterium]|nr:hypothetical protein [Gemmatimonadales bacterium]